MKRYSWLITTMMVAALALTSCSPKIATTTVTVTATETTTSAGVTTAPPATSTSTAPTSTPPPATPPATTAKPATSSSLLAELESALEAIYNRVNPSVVNIDVVLPGGGALGSGFVWDTQGHIVTNNHVVDGATSVTVSFSDGTIVDAKIVGTDPDSDLAVLKVAPNGIKLQPVTMADSTQVKVGQLAIAIGNPFGLQGTLTVGFVSAVARTQPANFDATGPSYSIPAIIQTDASINPGNSGGVLLDDAGKVIGVTQSISSTSGSSAGVGFAIPSQIIQKVVPSLITTGRYDHPYLGVALSSLVPDLAKAMNLPATQRGALIKTVTAGGPADRAGLRASTVRITIGGVPTTIGGDVVISVGEQTVKSSDDLIAILALSGTVGQTVTFTVLRNGQQVQIPVTLGARPGP